MPRKKSCWSPPEYQLIHWSVYDYADLDDVPVIKRAGRGDNKSYGDCIIAADTETSKTHNPEYGADGRYIPHHNIVVAWTISIRCQLKNIVTLYGSRPSDFCICLEKIRAHIKSDVLMIYFHNLSYDWCFLERFLFNWFGEPVKQLNTKPYYPIYIEFENGIEIRDSLILAGESLEKWADDMDVEHKKAVGKWDYDNFRRQSDGMGFSRDELEYIEHDTLALAECIDALRIQLHHKIYAMPYTRTGIIRAQVRQDGRVHYARERFLRTAPDFDFYMNYCIPAYHGGYTHNNRNTRGWTWPDTDGDTVTCYDFASSYPYWMLCGKFPKEKFTLRGSDPVRASEIIEYAETTAFIFRFTAVNIQLKDPDFPMPFLQYSKCTKTLNAINDNGRILAADYIEIIITEIDLRILISQYDIEHHACSEVHAAAKGYLPKWYRNIVFQCFHDKTMLKGGDPVSYALAKAKVNSLYGMTCQRSIRPEITEDYNTGEFTEFREEDYRTQREYLRGLYDEYMGKRGSILPYYWGIYVTAYATQALFDLGACVGSDGIWLYSDTDSVYAFGWDSDKLSAFNQAQKHRLTAAGYGPVIRGDREYWPGVAEKDGEYKQFKGLHSKCYAVREMNEKLKITVAGVPKRGAACLGDDIDNFTDGFIFPGEQTGKLQHYYIMRNEIWFDAAGNECGNSVDLAPCDYTISMPIISDMFAVIADKEVEIQTYE